MKTTRIFLSLLAAVTIPLCGCGGSRPAPPPVAAPKVDLAPIRERSTEAQEKLEAGGKPGPAAEGSPQRLAPAPDVEPVRAKVLRKDPEGCTWIESEATVTVGGNDTRNQVHAAAVAQARQSAMQDFLGVEVKSRFMDFQQESLRNQQSVTESMLLTTRLGRIINEKVISGNYADLSGCRNCGYRLVLHSCLLHIPDYADKDFSVELEIRPRHDFIDGDEARLVVTANRDCFLYLYDVYLQGAKVVTDQVIPNEAMPQVALKAGETWVYPDESHKKKGINLMAQLPPGQSLSTETIRLIATKTPLPKKLYDPSEGGYLAVYRRLNAARIDWSEDAVAFTIVPRQ